MLLLICNRSSDKRARSAKVKGRPKHIPKSRYIHAILSTVEVRLERVRKRTELLQKVLDYVV